MSDLSLLTSGLREWVEEFIVAPPFDGHPVEDEWQQFVSMLPDHDLSSFADRWFSCVSDWTAPDQKDIDVLEFSANLPNMYIEQVDPNKNTLVATLAGSNTRWVLGHDITHESTGDYALKKYRASMQKLDELSISLKRPHFLRGQMSFAGRDHVTANFLSLPVLNRRDPARWYYFTCLAPQNSED